MYNIIRAKENIVSQYTLATVLVTALEVCDLPLQCPTLHILDDIDDLKSAFRQDILTLHRKGSVINSVLNKPFLIQFLQPWVVTLISVVE